MSDTDTKRLSRLVALLTLLQSKRIVTAPELAGRFAVSVRTIYRDIRTLEQAGVPVLTDEGKGYRLMEGYSIPPVMFTENEANALVTAEQLVLKGSDSSLSREYTTAVSKIKAVLRNDAREKADLLSGRIAVSPAAQQAETSNSLVLIQQALTAFKVLAITYHSAHKNEQTERQVEPFALYYSLQESWLLIGYCRLRKDYRMFRLNRVLSIKQLDSFFEPHKMTLETFLAEKQKNFTTPDIPLS